MASSYDPTSEGIADFLQKGVRAFQTGATRDLEINKPDYEGYLSPLVLRRFGLYMARHQQTAAGLRASDNWQLGIPKPVYMKSGWRHFMDWWLAHRGQLSRAELEEALCGLQIGRASCRERV